MGTSRRRGGAVRLRRSAGGFSTDCGMITRPQGGDCEVIRILSTGWLGARGSLQLRPLGNCWQALSTGCGQNFRPQGVSKVVHRSPTGNGLLPTASPQPCPLFGNETPVLTSSSESRHTRGEDWPVGNRGKAGDEAGENSLCPVYGVCRTFGCPQRPLVIHRFHPQARWTKNWV